MSETKARAKDAAVNELVSVVVYFAIVGGVSFIILKRYYLQGMWKRLTERRMSGREAAVEREVADFRRELGKLNHPSTRKQRGLYEDL